MKPAKQSAYLDAAVELNKQLGLTLSGEEIELVQQQLRACVGQILKRKKNNLRLKNIDLKKESAPAEESLTDAQIASLPSWLRSQIKEARVVGASKAVIQGTDGRKYHLNIQLHHLSGEQCTFFLSSLINTRYPTSGPESYAHSLRKAHPSPKPPQLLQEIIEFFTKEGEVVFDYFMGVGGSLIAASLAGRAAIGIELNPEFIEIYKQVCSELDIEEQKAIRGDSSEILSNPSLVADVLKEGEASLILIDPPYGNMMTRQKTGQATKSKLDSAPTPFTDSDLDLGNLELADFYARFQKIVGDSLYFLKDKGHVVVFIKDLQPERVELNLLHARLIEDLHAIDGLRYLGLKVWADQGVNLYPYGYPYAFVPNQIHQYILIFKREHV